MNSGREGYGVGLRIKRSSVRIRPWPLRWVLRQGSLLPLSKGEAFTLASISYLAILVKDILAKKKKNKHQDMEVCKCIFWCDHEDQKKKMSIRPHQKKFLFLVAKVEKNRVGKSVQNLFWTFKFWLRLTTQCPPDIEQQYSNPLQIILLSC